MSAIENWSTDDVQSLLEDIGLGHLAPKFKDNGVNGKDLLELEDDDYRESLGCSNLQVRQLHWLTCDVMDAASYVRPRVD